ncbi:MAG TPA: cupin domain-containing protein [Thermomicrobiales bacterium]|nr:cupin domain-containing protein [Thermomicrobiales bacterium]
MDLAQSGQELGEPSSHPLFEGEAFLRPMIDRGNLRVNEVEFSAGGRTRWHVHTFEQVLIITDGAGIVATDAGEREVAPGDVVMIVPGERHWHGGRPDRGMRHISINGPGETAW